MANPCGCSSDVHSFNWFNIDGLPCDPCSDTFVCKYHYPAKCAIINVDLPCLSLTSGTNLETAFLALNDFVCNSSNITFAGQDSSTIHWTAGGPAGHQPTAAVKVSSDSGNILVIHSDGLYVPTPPDPGDTEDWMVKVDSGDTPAFLEAQIIGESDINDFLEITVTKVSGQLQIKPVFDLAALAAAICDLCAVSKPTVSITCGSASVFGTFTLGTPTVALVQIPVTVTGSGSVTITITNGNGSFFGSTTQLIDSSTTFISCSLFYNGSGTNGTQNITATFAGTQNTITPCNISIEVANSVSCTHVSIADHDPLPDATVGSPYSFTLYLNGSQPFALSAVVKPAWMTIAVVNDTVVFSGTPANSDAGTGITISFTVTNCTGAGSANFSDTIDMPQCISYNMSAATGTPSVHYTDCDGVVHDTLVTTNTIICTNGRSFTVSSGSISINSSTVGDC